MYNLNETVYHWKYGKGQVVTILTDDAFPISVGFESIKHKEITFSSTGKELSNDTVPTLSKTPYDLINGGFSNG